MTEIYGKVGIEKVKEKKEENNTEVWDCGCKVTPSFALDYEGGFMPWNQVHQIKSKIENYPVSKAGLSVSVKCTMVVLKV